MVHKKNIPILFVNPLWFEGSTFDEFISKTPPLGLTYIAAVLEKEGYKNIRVLDMKGSGINFEQLKKELEGFSPVILGITLATGQVSSTIRIIKMAKMMSPNIFCVIGGPHPSALPEDALRETGADLCVYGEGEETMIEVVDAIIKEKGFSPILGIAFREEGLIKKNYPRPLIEDLDALPFPARHLLPSPREYCKGSKLALSSIEAVVMTSRGCPFRCSFCDKSVFGRSLRVRSAANVADEIELLIKEYGVESIRFFDDLLTAIPSRIEEICAEFKKRKFSIKWICEARVDTISQELLKMMKEAGCAEIHYGIESGNQAVLDLQQKDIKLDQVRQAVKWTNEAGIASRGYFIVGLPGDTKKTIKETIKFGRSLNLASVGVSLYAPYPGNFTRKYRLEDYGKVLAIKWDDYTNFDRPSFLPNGLTEKELMKLNRRAYLLMYLNLKTILGILKNIRNFPTLLAYIRAFFWSTGLKNN